MTLLVPLDGTALPQAWPAFVSPADDPATLAARVVQTVLRAKRIAVVCGAGISVQAGIPDFRSADGLFQSIKRENPKENLSSGKDLFDASVLNSEHTTALFYQMMARLARLSSEAAPTPFHSVLRELDDRGKLLRVYTQNIDALEEKAGMSFGLPENRGRRARTKAQKSAVQSGEELNLLEGSSNMIMGVPPQRSETADASLMPSPASTSTGARSTPRCIPLHGTLQTVHCVSCTHSFPLSDHLPSLLAGVPPDCPECAVLEATRSLVGKRPRGVGRLRPSVVLYNEDHRDGEDVGAVVRRDLARGARGGADVLLVVGTSLRVPGTKRIVREFAKAVRARERARADRALEVAQARAAAALPTPAPTPTPTSSPSPSPRRTPVRDDEAAAAAERPITTVYVNLDFPVPTREWDGVFDVWVQGDAQMFAGMLHEEMIRGERERAEKMERDERAREERRVREDRRRREREARQAEREELGVLAPKKKAVRGRKRAAPAGDAKPAKRRRVTLIVRDPATPLSPKSPSKRAAAAVAKGKGRGAQSSALETTNGANASAGVKSDFAPQRSTKHTGIDSSKSPSSRHLHISAPGRTIPEVVITTHPTRPRSPSSLSSSSVSTAMDSPDTHTPGESGSETGSANLCSWSEREHEPGGSSSLDLLACAAASRPRASFGSGSSSPVDVCGEGEDEDEDEFTPCLYGYVPQCTCPSCSDEEEAYDARPSCVFPLARAPPTPLSMSRKTRAGKAAAGMGTRGTRAHAYTSDVLDGSLGHPEDDGGAAPSPAAPARRKRARVRTSVRRAGVSDAGWSAAVVSEEDRPA